MIIKYCLYDYVNCLTFILFICFENKTKQNHEKKLFIISLFLYVTYQ